MSGICGLDGSNDYPQKIYGLPMLQGTDVEVFLSQPGLVQTPLNGRKLDHKKLVAIGVDIATKVYGQGADRAANCLKRPATDPNVRGENRQQGTPLQITLVTRRLL